MADFDFIRLTFDGKTTTDFNLYVVSNSDRYNISLSPNFENRTTSIPGRPGLIYWGTDLKQQDFSLSLATNSMSSVQLSEFKKHFQPGKVGALSFEEEPYKYYNAMIMAPPELSFVPFPSSTGGFIYKGEMTLMLTTLDSYAHSDSFLADSAEKQLANPESGLPLFTDFPLNDHALYHIAKNKRIQDRVLTVEKLTNQYDMLIYHAGNVPSPITLSFDKTYLLQPETEDYAPYVEWQDIIVDKAVFMKPRFFTDIETMLELVYLHFDNWEDNKTNVLNILREELDGSARATLIFMAQAVGAVYTTYPMLVAAVREAFFTDVVYRFTSNGENKQSLLEAKNATKYSSNLVSSTTTYLEDNAGAFNGKYLFAEPSGVLPVIDGLQTLTSNQRLSGVEIDFLNMYL